MKAEYTRGSEANPEGTEVTDQNAEPCPGLCMADQAASCQFHSTPVRASAKPWRALTKECAL